VPMANCAASTRSAAAPTRLFAAISTAYAKSSGNNIPIWTTMWNNTCKPHPTSAG